MKKFILISGLALSFVTSASAQDAKINFHSLNPVLQLLGESVTQGDDQVEWAYPQFDAKVCSVKAERLKWGVQGALKNTPWLDAGRAEFSAASTLAVNHSLSPASNDASSVGIELDVTASVRTDVLAMFRYSALLAGRKTPESWFVSIAPQFKARYFELLKHAAVATSLDEVADLMQAGQRLGHDLYGSQITGSEQALAMMTPDTEQKYPGWTENLKSAIAGDKALLSIYDTIKITPVVEGGKVRAVTVESKPSDSGLWKRTNELSPSFVGGRITETELQASGTGVYRMSPDDLGRFERDFKARLSGMQEGAAQDKQLTQDDFRTVLIAFKHSIKGENF